MLVCVMCTYVYVYTVYMLEVHVVSSHTQSGVFPCFSPPLPPPSYDQVFKSLSPIHRARTHTEPYCADIIELLFSVSAMDHLSGVQDRHSYDSLEGTHREEENELKEVRGMGEVGREVWEVEGGITFYALAFY